MRRTTNWTIVGTLLGSGVGFIFGPMPAFALVFGILEDWLDSPGDERIAFAVLWGACFLLLSMLGAVIGYLLARRSSLE